MKRIHIKTAFMAIVMVAAFCPGVHAQQATAITTVGMTVKGQVSFSVERNLNLGVVEQGVTHITVDPINGGYSAGYFIFGSSPHNPIIVSYATTSLVSDGNTIKFSGKMAGGTSSEQTGAVILSSGTGLVTNSQGQYFFWIGGTANLSQDQPLGVYTGSFTISIAY